MRTRGPGRAATVLDQRPLRRDRGVDGSLRLVERREELVRARVDLLPAPILDRRPNQPPMRLEHRGNSAPSDGASAVDPSMSVKRKVTIPLGRATRRV